MEAVPDAVVLDETLEPAELLLTEELSAEAAEEPEIVAELLIEEISIDGMCGVY
jgi:mycofactocin precursor